MGLLMFQQQSTWLVHWQFYYRNLRYNPKETIIFVVIEARRCHWYFQLWWWAKRVDCAINVVRLVYVLCWWAVEMYWVERQMKIPSFYLTICKCNKLSDNSMVYWFGNGFRHLLCLMQIKLDNNSIIFLK